MLRAPVRKNGIYCFKGGQFDFFYIFMENRLRLHPFIKDINVNNQNPLKLSFEAVIITRICEPLVQNAIFISSLTHYTLLLNPLIFVKMI